MSLTLFDEREYPSTRRGSDAKYMCKRWSDGTYTCNCPGWRFKKADQPRGCSHCEWFKQNYRLVTIREATELALKKVKWDKITTYNGTNLWLIKMYDTEPRNVPAVTSVPDNLFGRPVSRAKPRIGNPAALPMPATRPVDPRRFQPLTNNSGRARRVFDEEV